MTYPFKDIALNRNRKIIAVANPSADITQMVAKAVPGVAYSYRGVWSSTMTINQGDIVLYGTTMWLALTPSSGVTPTTGSVNWQSIGSYSAFRGAWSSAVAYVAGDEVTYSNNFWVAVAPNTNSAPTLSNANWQIAGPDNLSNVMLPTADANGNWVAPFSTSQGDDDAGWSNEYNWGSIKGTLPAGVSSAVAAGSVQAALPSTTNTKGIWASDNGGTPYETVIYGTEIDGNTVAFLNGISGAMGPQSAWTQVGSTIVIPNPGQQVNIGGLAVIQVDQSGATTAFRIACQCRISTDSGSTWTTAVDGYAYFPTTSVDIRSLVCPITTNTLTVTPTGDIWIQFGYDTTAGAGTFVFYNGIADISLSPNSSASLKGATLTDNLASTATASATATYPATTAAASKTLNGGGTGGISPLSYSNSRTGNGSGTSDGGSITAGATAANFTVTTGTLSAGTYTGVYSQTVTDSTTPTAQTATNNCTLTTTITDAYAAISPSIAVTGGSCSTGTSSGTCTASGTFSVSATGGNGSYTYSNSVYSHDSGFSTNPTIASGATAATGTYSGAATTTIIPGTKLKVTLQTSVNDTRGTGAQTATGYNYLTFKYTS